MRWEHQQNSQAHNRSQGLEAPEEREQCADSRENSPQEDLRQMKRRKVLLESGQGRQGLISGYDWLSWRNTPKTRRYAFKLVKNSLRRLSLIRILVSIRLCIPQET